MAWVNPTLFSGSKWIVGRRVAWNDRFLFARNDSTTGFTNQFVFQIFRTNPSCSGNAGEVQLKSGTALSTNTWHHVAGVVNGSDILLYVNGVLATSTTMTDITNFVCTADAWEIGGDGAGGGWGGYFNGNIDEPRIYNRALSAAEVQAIYNATQ